MMQDAQAHYDSVLVERETLWALVTLSAPAVKGYREGVDALGDRFSPDGVVQDSIRACIDGTAGLVEVMDETTELLVALDKGQVGLERFKMRFARFDSAWVAENDCWRALWANETFEAWRNRWDAQMDTLAARKAERLARARAAAKRQTEIAACIRREAPKYRLSYSGPHITLMTERGEPLVRYERERRLGRFVYTFARFHDAFPPWADEAYWQAQQYEPSTLSSNELPDAMVRQWAASDANPC